MRTLLLVFILFFGCTQPVSDNIAEESSLPAEPSGPASVPDEQTDQPAVAEPPPEEPATSLESEEIVYVSSSWDIHATMYPAQQPSPTKVIMLVPMLGETRDSYPIRFIERLHDEFPQAIVMTIDPRGHGESTNLGTWQDFDTFAFKNMKLDVIDVHKYLQPKIPTIKEYYVIGASIGSTSAINAGAQVKNINKIVMISPGDYHGVDIDDAVDDYAKPLLVVVGDEDRYSYQKTIEIQSAAQQTKIYKMESAHGTDLFDATKDGSEPVEELIIDFLK